MMMAEKLDKNPVLLPEIQSDPDYKNTRNPHTTLTHTGEGQALKNRVNKLCLMPTRINHQIAAKRGFGRFIKGC